MNLLYIDLFCGAGGTSTGVNLARINGEQCAEVIACVNHDANAIASHAANHPEALHFTEDIRVLNLDRLVAHLWKKRSEYPDAKIVLWASLECTNFSKAKGGQPRDADSRTLAEHLFKYIETLNPDYIQIENVEEFMSWGDMDEKGKPLSKDKGRSYRSWVKAVKNYGYDFDHRILNSADYGAYTCRKRFFGIFAKDGLPIVFPEATHSKKGSSDMFSKFKKWKPVKDCLEFEDEGTSIFSRNKNLSDKTLERIYAGLIKFVAVGKYSFLSRYNTTRPKDTCKSIDDPCGVLTTNNLFAKVHCSFLSKQFSGHPESKNISTDGPAGSITTIDHHLFVQPKFLSAYYGNGDNVSPVDAPSPVVTTKDRLALVSTRFLYSYNFKDAGKDINSPCPTLLTKDRLALSTIQFMDMQYGNGTPKSIDTPAATVTSTPKLNLISCKPWIMNTNFSNVGSSIEEPSQVITANRKWHYLMNPQFQSKGSSVDDPRFTLIARMDKMPPYLVMTEEGYTAIEIYPDDSDVTVKIKEFMAAYGIVDIKMRMLKIPELKMIMGFPKDYVLIGTQADQKKFIGNAVEVNMAKVLCEALCNKLIELEKISA